MSNSCMHLVLTFHGRLGLFLSTCMEAQRDWFVLFLPERDYVTFGSAVAIPSVCLSSVTLVHPTQGVEPFGKISSPLCTLAIL